MHSGLGTTESDSADPRRGAMNRHVLALIVVIGLVAASCGDDDAATTTTTTTAPATTMPAPTTTAADTTTTLPETTTTEAAVPTLPDPPFLTVGDSEHGSIVTDDEGMSLYAFLPDDRGASTCTGGCAATWPPLVDDVGVGPGIDPDLVGSVARADGSLQVTYAGWPLYYYAPDAEPGDT
jgi:predicted lipoprotein with Yx(FWY)xxD motif